VVPAPVPVPVPVPTPVRPDENENTELAEEDASADAEGEVSNPLAVVPSGRAAMGTPGLEPSNPTELRAEKPPLMPLAFP
jgi:hypothetical protein